MISSTIWNATGSMTNSMIINIAENMVNIMYDSMPEREKRVYVTKSVLRGHN